MRRFAQLPGECTPTRRRLRASPMVRIVFAGAGDSSRRTLRAGSAALWEPDRDR